MAGLTRITLHNSYYTGLSVSVKAEGHTNCSGTNAAGKTTMLQLIPFFYGCPPRLLNSKNADKLPFVDFVLPSHNSLIIYDYARHDGDYCVAVYKSNQGNAHYRILKGQSSHIFFQGEVHEQLKQGKIATDIFSLMAANSIEMSSPLRTITEYAAVIQGDAKSLRKSGDKNRASDAQRFGLSSPQHPMRLTGEMTFTLLKRSKMYERLKMMIADSMFEYAAPDIPNHKKNARLSNELRALRAFAEHSETIKVCLKRHEEHLHLKTRIDRYAAQVRASIAPTQHKLEKYQSERTRKQRQFEELKETYEDKRDGITQERVKVVSAIEELNRKIQSAETQQETWLDKNIPEKRIDYENLGDYRQQVGHTEKHYHALLENSRDISEQKASQLAAIKERLNQQKSDYLTQKDALNEALQNIEAIFSDKKLEHLQSQQDELKALDTEESTLKEERLPQKGQFNAEINNVAPTNEEKERLENAQDNTDKLDYKINHLNNRLNEAKKASQTAKHDLDSALITFKKHSQKQEKTATRLYEIEQLLYPEDNSLLAHLRREHPQWQDNIGKIIHPGLLQRKDLSPTIATTPENSTALFDLQVNLERIAPPEHSEEETLLQERLQKTQTQQRILEDENKQLKEKADNLRKDWETQNHSHEDLQRQLKSAFAEKNTALEHLQSIRQEIGKQQTERKQQLKEKLTALEKQIAEETKQFAKQRDAIAARHDANQKTLVDDKLLQRSEIQQKIDHLSTIFQHQEEQAKAQTHDIESAFEKQCQEQSIDSKTLNSAKAQYEKAEKKLKEVQSYAETLQAYDHWYSTIWQHVTQDREEKNTLEKTSEQFEKSLQRHKSDFNTDKKSLAQAIKTLDNLLHRETDTLTTAQNLLKNIIVIDDTHDETESPADSIVDTEQESLESLCHNLQTLTQEESQLKKALLESISEAVQTVRNNPDSLVYEAWKTLNDERLGASQYPENSEAFQLNLPLDLAVLIEKQVPNIQGGIVNAIQAAGGAYAGFYHTLRQLETDVAKVSRELKEKVNTNQRIAALENIELALSSRISTVIEGWADLENFVTHWEDWNSGLSQELPPKALERSLDRVINYFQSSSISMDIGSLFDLEIRMIESGRSAKINSNASFEDASSNGLSYLALVVIFIGMSRYLCPDKSVTLTWPIDELATLDPKNVAAMFAMLQQNNIAVFSAFPSTDYNLLQHFSNCYLLERKTGAREFVETRDSALDVSALVDTLNQQERTVKASHHDNDTPAVTLKP